MPILRMKNFLAASRKRNMVRFGMYRSEDVSSVDVIDDAASETIGITGTQNGSNKAFTVSAPVSKLFRNGLLQATPGDYSISGATLTWVVAPSSDDIILGFAE